MRWVDLSMPDYVPKALDKLGHKKPTRPQHAPHLWTAPTYGEKVQFANNDLSPLLDKLGIKRVQRISGIFLYYGRAVDQTIIVALATRGARRRHCVQVLVDCWLSC